MDDRASVRGFLLHLAAEAVAAGVVGAAAGAGFGPLGAVAGSAAVYFGPRIAQRWLPWFRATPPAEASNKLEALANLPADAVRQEARQLVDQLAPPQASAEDRRVTADYLAAIPISLRASMIVDPASGRSTCPADLVPRTEAEVIQLLPTAVPPYPVPFELREPPYKLVELLGMGGFGAVYKALNSFEQYAEPRAIKFCLDERAAATLHRERKNLERLRDGGREWSGGIVRLYGYGLEAKPPYLIYEYVAGGDLSAYLLRRRAQTGRAHLTTDEANALVRKIAEALAVAHRAGLVHRDLKPGNVLTAGAGGDSLKLADFGIGAVASAAVTAAATRGAASLEQSQFLRRSGTPLYMAPEQRRGDAPDPRNDIYALGVLWYQLLAGDTARALEQGWPKELERRFNVPRDTIGVIAKCVDYFDDRPRDGAALLALMDAHPGYPPMMQPMAPMAPIPPIAPMTPMRPVEPLPDKDLVDLLDGLLNRKELSAVAGFIRNAGAVGLRPSYKGVQLSLLYQPRRPGAVDLNVLEVNQSGGVFSRAWLTTQLETGGLSSRLASEFWSRLHDIDARFPESGGMHLPDDAVPLRELVANGALPRVEQAVKELVRKLDSVPGAGANRGGDAAVRRTLDEIYALLRTIPANPAATFSRDFTLNGHAVTVAYDPQRNPTYPLTLKTPSKGIAGKYDQLGYKLKKAFGPLLPTAMDVPPFDG